MSSMQMIPLSVLNLRANKENAMATDQIYLNISPDFNRCYEAWDDALKTRFIESILLGRATNPIWVIFNDDEDTEEILDGMHRITTALGFLNNSFALQSKYFMCITEKDKYNKKRFNDLDSQDKQTIRNYNFYFNKLDSSYRKDMNKLQDMYELLNRSSRILNDYEYNKPILGCFYKIIMDHKPEFIKTHFFGNLKDTRGAIDTQIIEMLVLAYPLTSSWSSISQYKEGWIKSEIGDTAEKVAEFLRNRTMEVEYKLSFMTKIINQLQQKKLFSEDKKIFKTHRLLYGFLISRCCLFIPSIAVFNRVIDQIIETMKKEILIDNILVILGCSSRNADFQRKVLEKIDEIIQRPLLEEGSERRFSKKVIQDKLSEQNGICPQCNTKILETDKYEGDHIIAWTAGGKTIPENLQVLHKRCHQLKH